ncbi:MAG: hypothetical protein H6810_01555 [Phycisphaeraceae bacterium]|nr:MAG: hypothetical protein H6810_01555 [Phycisphaeraceae bacterium]
MSKHHVLALLALAGSVAPLMAQDSVANTPGLPGDAINPIDPAQQVLPYVADLTPFGTSWDTTFGIVPLVKTPKTDPTFFNNLMSANGISDDLRHDVPYFSNSYLLWEQAPGAGANPLHNDETGYELPTGTSSQFSVGFASSASLGGFSGDLITTAIVNYKPSSPNRLYVTRVESAGVYDSPVTGSSGSLAFGSTDADGNTYYRGDSFGAGGTVAPQVANNWYRTRAQSRTGVVNTITGAGGVQATDHLVSSTTAHPAPSNIPASVAGGNGLVAGPNYSSQYVRGAMAPLTADSSHFGPEVTLGYTPADHRGAMGTTTRNLLGTGVATTAELVKDGVGNTRALGIFSTTAAGAVAEAHTIETPLTIGDPTDGFSKSLTSISAYSQYYGITGFRSGGGLVALGQDSAGNNYAAATLSTFGLSFDLDMQNVAVRFGPDGQNPEWSIVGWTDFNGNGKDILDGPGGSSIGHLIDFQAAFPSSGLLGPSMSTPTFDGAGNAWFLASAALDKVDPDTGDPFIDYDTVLIRGVLTEYPGMTPSYGYQLELVLELGRTFFGQNSGTRWQIQFMQMVANSNTSGVLSPGAVDHNNGRTWGYDDADLSGVDNADPMTNGGIVVAANIVYDVDGDGVYEDPTGSGADPNSPDQAYDALLYIGYYTEGPQGCNAADIAEPYGLLDLADINAFISGFLASDPIADVNGDGLFDLGDINTFVAAFLSGCP